FQRAMKRAGRPCELIGYEDAGHGFFNRGKALDETTAAADKFLVGLGWLKPKS
ncbi:MAG: dienelactone hydrolase family protein, partial [Verrucomicrobiae bacterium]|nr:dienelactone hydrolase family protein [Verrucomicrobiae bacterium]